ncbi:hypothetical protein G9A89_005950 [Geosiphon pyriformis]|nr:hypothetical protein G9A89_005950 [Geosiphon pyriformis]
MQRVTPQPGRFITDAPITSSVSTASTALNVESTTTTTTSQQAFFARAEEHLNQRLDSDVEQLLDCFKDIVRLASFTEIVRLPGTDFDKTVEKDKFRTALDGCAVELRAANIARSCENLFLLTHELKTTLLLNDTETLIRLRKQRTDELKRRKDKIKLKVIELDQELIEAIWEMESALGGFRLPRPQ